MPEEQSTSWETVPDGLTQVVQVDWLTPNLTAYSLLVLITISFIFFKTASSRTAGESHWPVIDTPSSLSCSQFSRNSCFSQKGFLGIIFPRDDFGKIAELFRLQDNLSAWVCSPRRMDAPKLFEPTLRKSFCKPTAVKNSALPASAFNQGCPLVQKFFCSRPLPIDSGVIR